MVSVAIFAFTSPKLGKIRTPRTGESGIGGRSKEAQTNKQLIIRNISRRRERQKVDSKTGLTYCQRICISRISKSSREMRALFFTLAR